MSRRVLLIGGAIVVPLLVLVLAIGIAPRAVTDRVPPDAIPAAEGQR